MEHFDYKPSGVCPMQISFDLEGDTVHNVAFLGGCNGNLQAISRVVEGMTIAQIEGYFKGVSCSGRGTSCSDQLATAVRTAYESRH
ncbi:MAG: TIGR03905 family TSCPD domain-containing protein [Eubacteriales bacterium]|nr:TIGR03905 family TSCPD domain-containing protein [Eubacteriales bacterium]